MSIENLEAQIYQENINYVMLILENARRLIAEILSFKCQNPNLKGLICCQKC